MLKIILNNALIKNIHDYQITDYQQHISTEK